MIEIGAFEAKNRLGHLLDRVESGEEVVITRHGKAVARLVPHKAGAGSAETAAAIERLRTRASSMKRGSFAWKEWKAFRDEGRQ
jgi:prevent-host-death family protein